MIEIIRKVKSVDTLLFKFLCCSNYPIFFSEARLLSLIPDTRGPILDHVIRKKLYRCATEIMIPLEQILRYNLKKIGHQLLQETTNIEAETEELHSDNGPFNNLPREILFKIFSYLNLYSLGKVEL